MSPEHVKEPSRISDGVTKTSPRFPLNGPKFVVLSRIGERSLGTATISLLHGRETSVSADSPTISEQ